MLTYNTCAIVFWLVCGVVGIHHSFGNLAPCVSFSSFFESFVFCTANWLLVGSEVCFVLEIIRVLLFMFKQYLSCDICNPCHRADSGKWCHRSSISIPSSSVLLCACTCNGGAWCNAVSFEWCHGFKLKSAANYFPSWSPEGTAEAKLIILRVCTCSGSRLKISVLKTDVLNTGESVFNFPTQTANLSVVC